MTVVLGGFLLFALVLKCDLKKSLIALTRFSIVCQKIGETGKVGSQTALLKMKSVPDGSIEKRLFYHSDKMFDSSFMYLVNEFPFLFLTERDRRRLEHQHTETGVMLESVGSYVVFDVGHYFFDEHVLHPCCKGFEFYLDHVLDQLIDRGALSAEHSAFHQ